MYKISGKAFALYILFFYVSTSTQKSKKLSKLFRVPSELICRKFVKVSTLEVAFRFFSSFIMCKGKLPIFIAYNNTHFNVTNKLIMVTDLYIYIFRSETLI